MAANPEKPLRATYKVPGAIGSHVTCAIDRSGSPAERSLHVALAAATFVLTCTLPLLVPTAAIIGFAGEIAIAVIVDVVVPVRSGEIAAQLPAPSVDWYSRWLPK